MGSSFLWNAEIAITSRKDHKVWKRPSGIERDVELAHRQEEEPVARVRSISGSDSLGEMVEAMRVDSSEDEAD
jgi:hypothetical protein